MMCLGCVSLELFFSVRLSVSLKCVSFWLASMSLERVDLGKMNLQLIANEENQDRAQCGKN